MSDAGLMRWYEQEAARFGLTGLLPADMAPMQHEEAPTITMVAPPDWTGTFCGINGTRYLLAANERVAVTSGDALPLRRLGFVRAEPIG